MYDRKIDEKILDFEASGSLYHSALVMQDDQTESFWAIMDAKAIGGALEGAPLVELPISEKTTWAKWRARFPDTMVLSVEGETHIDRDPYANYFTSDRTFRPVEDPDTRLGLKDSIFTFRRDGQEFAVAHKTVLGGWQGTAAGQQVFLYRHKDDSIYQSTRAYSLIYQDQSVPLVKRRGKWRHADWGEFDPRLGTFAESDVRLPQIAGIDTFWYIWSQYHPDGVLLSQDGGN